MIMCNAWKNFKTFLNRDYVKKDLTPDFDKEYPKLRPFWEEFVEYKKSEAVQAIAQWNKVNSEKNIYPHVLGSGGYVKKVPEWEKREEELTASGAVPATSELSTRSKHWMLARGATLSSDGSLSFRSERVHEVAQKLREAHVQSSQGSFQPRRENDELTLALGTKEHGGRTRGVGLVPWKNHFLGDADMYRRRKRSLEEELDALVQAEVQAQVQHVQS